MNFKLGTVNWVVEVAKDSGMLGLGWTVDCSAWIVGGTQGKAESSVESLVFPLIFRLSSTMSWTPLALASFGIEDKEMK